MIFIYLLIGLGFLALSTKALVLNAKENNYPDVVTYFASILIIVAWLPLLLFYRGNKCQ